VQTVQYVSMKAAQSAITWRSLGC